jgi:putative transposase
MPNHVHALVWMPQPDQFPRLVHGWKRMSSFRIRRWYAAHAPAYFQHFGAGDRFWQPKSYVFHLHSESKLREKLVYLHENPVRARLVARAVDWPWSSARWYEQHRSVGVPVQWIA